MAARRKELESLIADPPLHEELLIVPLSELPLRVAKFDVVLRDASLWAVHAMHKIMSREVLFHCKVCRERFQTFHPAYDPIDMIDMELRRGVGRTDVPACSIEVWTWDVMPALDAADIIAPVHTGTCLACQRDVEEQQRKLAAQDGEERRLRPVPKRSFMNDMDPCWTPLGSVFGEAFMAGEVRGLFQSLTVVEAMQMLYVQMQERTHGRAHAA